MFRARQHMVELESKTQLNFQSLKTELSTSSAILVMPSRILLKPIKNLVEAINRFSALVDVYWQVAVEVNLMESGSLLCWDSFELLFWRSVSVYWSRWKSQYVHECMAWYSKDVIIIRDVSLVWVLHVWIVSDLLSMSYLKLNLLCTFILFARWLNAPTFNFIIC